MTFAEFIVAASVYANNSHLNMGRAYMESLMFHRPDLYDEIVSRPPSIKWQVSPYYNNANLPSFLAFIAERWNREGPYYKRESEGVRGV